MARRSQRLSGNGTSISKHKRAASGEVSRYFQPKRPKNQPSSRTKRLSAENQKDEEEFDKDPEDLEDSPSSNDELSSEYDEDGKKSPVSESEDEDENDDEDGDETDEDPKPRKKSGAKNPTSTLPTSNTKGNEVWRPGVKTGLGPGKQVIIKKPKARDAGKIPYKDETIHPNTFLFLKDLAANNDRDWLKLNDPDFRASERDFHSFVEKMSEKLAEIDDTIPELPVKDVIFRIYRDMRFSKDPTPYKPWFSVAWSRAGRKGPYAHYYLQIAPGKSLCGGGLYSPNKDQIAAMRRDIDRNPRRIRDVLSNKVVNKEFLQNVPRAGKDPISAFIQKNQRGALSTTPKAYDKTHRDINLLRLQNYTLTQYIDDNDVIGDRGVHRIAEILSHLKPFITYLNSVVMPDDPESGSGGDEEEASDDDDDEEEE